MSKYYKPGWTDPRGIFGAKTMANDPRYLYPSMYDPFKDGYEMRVGGEKMWFTKEQWDHPTFVQESIAKYTGLTALKEEVKDKMSYTYLTSTSTEADRKRLDATISDEWTAMASKKVMVASKLSSTTPWDVVMKKASKNPFEDHVLAFEYVGSRVTCNPPVMDTDEDILILTDNASTLVGNCIEADFEVGGSKLGGMSEFTSMRKGIVNLIITESEEFFNKFMLATKVCKELNVLEKHNRVMVFDAIMRGTLTLPTPIKYDEELI